MKVNSYDYENIYDNANGDIDAIIKELIAMKERAKENRFSDLVKQLKQTASLIHKEFPLGSGSYLTVDENGEDFELNLIDLILDKDTSWSLN